jgi:hypothetical protein
MVFPYFANANYYPPFASAIAEYTAGMRTPLAMDKWQAALFKKKNPFCQSKVVYPFCHSRDQKGNPGTLIRMPLH